MEEKSGEEICRELAQAMGIGYEVFAPGTRPVSRWKFNPIQVWEDFGRLLEWAIGEGYWFNFAGLGHKPRVSAGVTFYQRGTKWGDGATAQEAMARAIHAAVTGGHDNSKSGNIH